LRPHLRNVIPANTLAVGDVIEIEAWGNYLNNSGANRNLRLRTYFDAVLISNPGGVNNLVSNASNRHWFLRLVIRMTTIGAAGTATAYADHAMSSPANSGSDSLLHARVAVPSGLDTTQPFDINVTAQMPTADATQTVTPRGVIVRKTPA
jgi:hypothetical protein